MNNLSDNGKIPEAMKKENPFSVPEGYFQAFPEKIQKRIADEIPGKKVKHFPAWKQYAAAAVIIMAIVIGGKMVMKKVFVENRSVALQSEISLMIENELYSINEATIMEVLDAENTGTKNGTLVDDEAVMDYLVNDEIDEQEIMNAL